MESFESLLIFVFEKGNFPMLAGWILVVAFFGIAGVIFGEILVRAMALTWFLYTKLGRKNGP